MSAGSKHNKRPYFILLAAGSGQRYGGDTPKQFLMLGGMTVIERCMQAALKVTDMSKIRVICDPDWFKLVHDLFPDLKSDQIVQGGSTRKCSVFNGLKSILHPKREDIVLIHDAARPLARAEDIEKLIASMDTQKAATLACRCVDTLKRANESDFVESTLERKNAWHVQTPQAFHLETLLAAHKTSPVADDATDDTILVSALDIPVKIIEGSRSNIKITTPDDMDMASKLLAATETEIRTGLGFDVHAFDTDSLDRPLMLGGVRIEHEAGLKGHSDADVGLHALTDALLGAIAAGDIGYHFPPSNPEFKNMDSAVFLRKACDLIKAQGGRIINIDLTFICEEPKIGPHARDMRLRIAEILQISAGRISVKATTSERLGFTGRREGIAAQAIATVRVPSQEL